MPSSINAGNKPGNNAEKVCTLPVRVQPKASNAEILGFRDGVLRVRVTAPPEDGKANAAAISLISKSLEIPRRSVRLIRGHSSRNKVFRVASLDLGQVKRRLGTEY